MKFKSLLTAALLLVFASAGHAATIKIAYSDWPGFTIFEVAKQKGWFKEAGVDVDLVWFADYVKSIDAYAGGKVDAVTVVGTDALVTGATGAKSKFIALLDYSDGSDMIIGKEGVKSIKDLKGKKVGIEVTLVEHLLLLEALKRNGMTQADVELVTTLTNETPQALNSGKVDAVGAWYPVSSQALKAVPGSTKLFTSADAKGLIYDVLAANPESYAKHKEEWTKIVAIYYKCVDFLQDPKTHDEAIKIMAAKVGASVDEYSANVPGTHFLTLKEAKAAMKKGDGLDSIYGSLANGDKFNVDNKVYTESQKPGDYVAPSIVESLK